MKIERKLFAPCKNGYHLGCWVGEIQEDFLGGEPQKVECSCECHQKKESDRDLKV